MFRGRHYTVATVAVIALLMAAPVSGQVYHQYPGAPVVGETEPALGATFGFGNDLARLLGYGRFNVSEVSDFGIEVLLDHFDPDFVDDGWRFGAGADFKYAIVPADTDLPFDLSVGGGIGFQAGNDVTNFNIPAGAVISRPLELQNRRVLVPYAGLYLVFSHVSIDVPAGLPDYDDSDLDVELRLGSRLEIGAGISGFVTVHISDDEMFFLGVNSSL
jgi:hypothetical protein